MKKNTFALLAKTYLRNYVRNEFSAEELIGLLRLSEKNLKEHAMFRFGKDSTILYTINEIEKDLLYSTKENKEFLQEQIKHACEVNEIIVE